MILKVNNLSKSYGNNSVLTDVSFEIKEPMILALVGPNGAGKSTLLNCITNLVKYDKGSIEVLGMKNDNPDIFKEISYLKDNTVLYPYLSGYDHLKYIADIQNLPKSRIDEVIDIIGIRDYVNKRIESLSLGMKQHILLAMAIMNSPKFIIMDEPLTGLDPDSIIQTRNLILSLFKSGTTILLSSHTLSEIDYITSDIIFLSKGTVIYEDINQYKEMLYTLTFSTQEKKNQFQNQLIHSKWSTSVQVSDDLSIPVSINSNDVHEFISFLGKQEIEFENLVTRHKGAEDRYRSIFGL